MGREVRRVRKDWVHPRDSRGNPIPLHNQSFSEALAEWEESRDRWDRGFVRTWSDDEPWRTRRDDDGDFNGWYGSRPVPEEYMPDWPEEERTHLQLYENVSEGTPISPPMPDEESLAHWLADNGANANAGETASYESWLAMIRQGWSVSMVGLPGGKLVSGVEFAGMRSKEMGSQGDKP